MTATNHTQHYELSQYTDNDHPTYTGDYNGDMRKIDAAIHAASQSGMTAVAHTNDLTGDGSAGNPLGVADTIARSEDIPSLDGYATTESVTQAIASAIADRLTAGDIKPGNGINIETSGNTVTISYAGGGSSGGMEAVAHDNTLAGDGTTNNALSVIGSFKNATGIEGTSSSTFDPNNYVIPGVYFVSADKSTSNIANIPTGLNDFHIRASLVVCKCGVAYGSDIAQLWLNGSGGGDPPFVSYRIWINGWGPWRRLAFTSDIPDVSALTSRIAALEQQVSALTAVATPSATGLTAEQLDSQYLDNYNIVRAGTPARSTETKDSSHE